MNEGQLGTEDFSISYYSADANNHVLSKISPWHQLPLIANNKHSYYFINEIPKGDSKKMEVSTKTEFNPIKQDIKKGKPRVFSYGTIPFNYGMLPQTWEDPTKGHSDLDPEYKGDNDPIDVVELSDESLEMGGIYEVHILGCIALIDEGEVDWKMLGIRTSVAKPSHIKTLEDLKNTDHGAQQLKQVFKWFRLYKTTDGKPENRFGLNEQVMNETYAQHVINETHYQWKHLARHHKTVESGKLWLSPQMA